MVVHNPLTSRCISHLLSRCYKADGEAFEFACKTPPMAFYGVGVMIRHTCRFMTTHFRLFDVMRQWKRHVGDWHIWKCSMRCFVDFECEKFGGNAFYYIIISTSTPFHGFTQKQTWNKELISRPDDARANDYTRLIRCRLHRHHRHCQRRREPLHRFHRWFRADSSISYHTGRA